MEEGVEGLGVGGVGRGEVGFGGVLWELGARSEETSRGAFATSRVRIKGNQFQKKSSYETHTAYQRYRSRVRWLRGSLTCSPWSSSSFSARAFISASLFF